jgi:hypothetical protein
MPSGVAVVDAFKSKYPIISSIFDFTHSTFPSDLIRHGKNHQNAAKATPDYSDTTSSSASSRTHNQTRAPKEQPQPAQMPAQPAEPSPDYTREAEMIVQEEREAKTKMPSYKGLEAYKILDKMGEYVTLVARIIDPMTDNHLRSAAPFLTSTRLSRLLPARKSLVSLHYLHHIIWY